MLDTLADNADLFSDLDVLGNQWCSETNPNPVGVDVCRTVLTSKAFSTNKKLKFGDAKYERLCQTKATVRDNQAELPSIPGKAARLLGVPSTVPTKRSP